MCRSGTTGYCGRHVWTDARHAARRASACMILAMPILILPHRSDAQQAALVTDTLRTSCSMQTPAARQCVARRLARRVSARLGLSTTLAWSPTQSAFVAGDLMIPAKLQYQEGARVITAVAIVELPRSHPLPSGLTTRPIGSQTGIAVVRHDSASSLFVHGPSDTIRVIIGREPAVALRFALSDRRVRTAVDGEGAGDIGRAVANHAVSVTAGRCRSDKGSPLTVAGSRMESDGTFTCYIRLGISATPNRVEKVHVALKAASRNIIRTLIVVPIAVPTYAVQGSDECKGIARRTQDLLIARGVPVVPFNLAHRRAALTNCERFDHILPAATGSLNPMGIYLTGDISESGVSGFTDPTTVGPIELWTTKPVGDPTDDLAAAIVSRLLKYVGL